MQKDNSKDKSKGKEVITIIKGFKIRIYPTKEQKQELWQHIGASRYIWNHMIDFQQKNYSNGEKYLSAFSMIKLITPLKNDREHQWLYDVSNATLQRTCSDLNEAYTNFFRKTAKHPKFRSRKRSKPSFPVRVDRFFFKDEKFLNIEKVGVVKYKTGL